MPDKRGENPVYKNYYTGDITSGEDRHRRDT